MSIENQLREKLRKVEALFVGASTSGERLAAGAAAERLKAKLAEAAQREPEIEMKFTLSDSWSVHLFIALCRRYGYKPYRYPRQRRTTLMVRAPRSAFDAIVWRQFADLHREMHDHFAKATEQLIREAVHANTTDADIVAESINGA